MKRIYFCIILNLMIFMSANSQTFHAIIFANTKNPSIGASVEEDLNRMKIELKSMANFIGYKYVSYEFKDYAFNRSNLEKTIEGMRCGSNDIVFFYYSGHGGRSIREKTDYPQMLLVYDESIGGDERTDLYPIFNVKERIKTKNPRLTIVMGDLCNSEAEWVSPKDMVIDKSPTIKSSGKSQFYKDLFFNMKGDIITVSSRPKETSKAYSDGGAFTTSFLIILQSMVSKKSSADWNRLLDLTQNFTNELVKKRSDGKLYQHPIYDITPTMVNNPPVGPTVQPNISGDIEEDIEEGLTSICYSGNDLKNRIKNIEPTLSRFFASPNSKIEVVGRDGKTIVNTTTASKYLNYISIATNMEQIMVLDEKKNGSGKVEYLKVHEMHNK